MRQTEAGRAAERVARLSYGRLVALLAARWGDVAAAEDALGDALARALERWPEAGVPEKPEAWLMTAARRRLIDAGRLKATAAKAEEELLRREDERGAAERWPDEGLKLLFACTHPAIPLPDRAPLMLQVVLGLTAARIAGAFLASPAAMGQRLSRAKARIRVGEVGLQLPGPEDIAGRTVAVLDAVYAAYTLGSADPGEGGAGLMEEAIWLAGLVAHLAPEEAEAHGLLALLLLAQARAGAGRDAAGAFVPLGDQDPALWDDRMMADGEAALRHAGTLAKPGRYQIEAAIQAVHAARRHTGRTDWEAIALLYEGLVALAPTVGALTARAAALGEARGPHAGLAALDAADPDRRGDYQPWWATRAHLLARAGQRPDAHAAFLRAAGLSDDPAVRRHLLARARGEFDA